MSWQIIAFQSQNYQMQKSNTLLYHGHIINNIESLDKRKDGYIGHRLEFLQEYCLPVRKKIEAIKQDIKYYENMRDTQYEVIESQPDIMQLKKQIADYTNTNRYYQNKLEEFDRCIAQLESKIATQLRQFKARKSNYRHLFNENGLSMSSVRSKINTHKVSKSDKSQEKSTYKHRDETKSIAGNESIQNSRQNITIIDNSSEADYRSKLPQIQNRRKSQNYYLSEKEKQLKRHQRNQNRLNKIIQREENYRSLRNSNIAHNPESLKEASSQIHSVESLKQAITQFDHTQALFRQCFQRKKLSIQKSVSQLQSKLITNKELFLTACEAIGQRSETLSLDQFCQLTTDEIITLFISFSWLGRKVYSEFAQKRKDLMGVLKKIKQMQSKQQ